MNTQNKTKSRYLVKFHSLNLLSIGGTVLSPDPIKPSIGSTGLHGSARRGKAQLGFLVNRATPQHRQSRTRQITTPGKQD